MTEVLLPVQKRILSEEEINEYYQAIGNPVGMWFEGIEPKDPNLKFIFETLDKTLGVDFLRTYRQLPQVGKTLAHVRYLVEATLILAKEICQPTLRPEDGTLLTNVYVPSLTQFDAVLVSGPTATQISSFKEVLVNPQPYDIIQLKTVFRARSTSGKKKLTKLPQEFKREQERQLGLTVWWWLSQGNETFPFPRSIVYHFLRGFMPHVVHRTKIDFLFFQRWAWLLEENISSAPEEQREHLSRLVVLLNQAEIKLTDRFRKEAAAIFAQLQANRVEEKAEQPPLFTL